jgi:hypothetical protein
VGGTGALHSRSRLNGASSIELNKGTGHRIKQRKVDTVTGQEVDSHNIIKGYETGKGSYIEIDPEELEAIAVESKRTIEIDQLVPKAEIDETLPQLPVLHRARRRGRRAGLRAHPRGQRSRSERWSSRPAST